MKLLFIIFLSMFLVSVLFLMNFLLLVSSEDKWKSSSLEAGFISTGKIHSTYSLQFFMLMIIFIIFDLEILFIFSFILKSSSVLLMNSFVLFFFLVTLFIEWKWAKLVWLN